MLHIKLPKGKVSRACERVAEQCSRRIAMRTNQDDILLLTQERSGLYDMADMAKHSTGDVYVDTKLWSQIKKSYG